MKRLILASLIILGLSCPSWSLTAADIITQVRVIIKDQSGNATRQYFPDSTLLLFMNDGQKEANQLAYIMQSSYTFSLTAGTTEYQMPSDYFTSLQTYVNTGTSFKKIDQTSFNQLDADNATWRSSPCGTAMKYYLDVSSQNIYMGIYPCVPTTPSETILTYYMQQLTDLTSTTQTPWNGKYQMYPYHSALIYYVTYRAYMTLEEPELANQYLGEWNQFLTTVRSGLNHMPDFNPGFGGTRASPQ